MKFPKFAVRTQQIANVGAHNFNQISWDLE